MKLPLHCHVFPQLTVLSLPDTSMSHWPAQEMSLTWVTSQQTMTWRKWWWISVLVKLDEAKENAEKALKKPLPAGTSLLLVFRSFYSNFVLSWINKCSFRWSLCPDSTFIWYEQGQAVVGFLCWDTCVWVNRCFEIFWSISMLLFQFLFDI